MSCSVETQENIARLDPTLQASCLRHRSGFIMGQRKLFVDVEIYKQTNKYGQAQELNKAHAALVDTVVMTQSDFDD